MLLLDIGRRLPAAEGRSAFHLEKAKARARAAAETIEWVQEDMRRFVRPDTYDLAISLYTSFGFFTNRANAVKRCLKRKRGLRILG